MRRAAPELSKIFEKIQQEVVGQDLSWLGPDEDAADRSDSQLPVSRNILCARIEKAAHGSATLSPGKASQSVFADSCSGRVLSMGCYLFVAGLARVRFWDVIARRAWPEVWRLRLRLVMLPATGPGRVRRPIEIVRIGVPNSPMEIRTSRQWLARGGVDVRPTEGGQGIRADGDDTSDHACRNMPATS